MSWRLRFAVKAPVVINLSQLPASFPHYKLGRVGHPQRAADSGAGRAEQSMSVED